MFNTSGLVNIFGLIGIGHSLMLGNRLFLIYFLLLMMISNIFAVIVYCKISILMHYSFFFAGILCFEVFLIFQGVFIQILILIPYGKILIALNLGISILIGFLSLAYNIDCLKTGKTLRYKKKFVRNIVYIFAAVSVLLVLLRFLCGILQSQILGWIMIEIVINLLSGFFFGSTMVYLFKHCLRVKLL